MNIWPMKIRQIAKNHLPFASIFQGQSLWMMQDKSGLNLYMLDAVTGHLLHQSWGLLRNPSGAAIQTLVGCLYGCFQK